jgi:hypothetical protein
MTYQSYTFELTVLVVVTKKRAAIQRIVKTVVANESGKVSRVNGAPSQKRKHFGVLAVL